MRARRSTESRRLSESERVKDPTSVYVATLEKMADVEGDAGLMKSGARDWNRLVKRLQEARKAVAQSDDGRRFVAALMKDERVTVKLWSASHALHWPEFSEVARRELESIAAERRNGLNRLNAEMTLSEFDAGRLNPEW